MTVEWTDQERKAVVSALTVEPVEPVGRPVVVVIDGEAVLGSSITIDSQGFAAEVLKALAPFVAAREAQAAARALREAGDAYVSEYGTWGGASQGAWLYERADRIERGES